MTAEVDDFWRSLEDSVNRIEKAFEGDLQKLLEHRKEAKLRLEEYHEQQVMAHKFVQ